jgi:Holliday junction resolvasome RuvABC endonuclease subunit
MITLGLDLSLTATGWSVVDTTRRTIGADTIATKPGVPMEQRLTRIVDALPAVADLVAVEDIAHGAIGGSKSERAALYWMTRVKMWRLGIPVAPVNVAHVKIYATGRGAKVEKTAMVDSLMRRLGVDRCPEFEDDNQVDSAWLALMAADRLGEPLMAMPVVHRAVLAKVKWPDLLSDDDDQPATTKAGAA